MPSAPSAGAYKGVQQQLTSFFSNLMPARVADPARAQADAAADTQAADGLAPATGPQPLNVSCNADGGNGGSSSGAGNSGSSKAIGGRSGGSGCAGGSGSAGGSGGPPLVGFKAWAAPDGWFGQEVTGQYFCEVWLRYALQNLRWELQDDVMAAITSDIVSLDHVMEPAKRVNGCSKALLLVCDKMRRVMAFFGTSTTGLRELEPELRLIHQDRYQANGLTVRPATVGKLLTAQPTSICTQLQQCPTQWGQHPPAPREFLCHVHRARKDATTCYVMPCMSATYV
jgi:hypothetical protein